MSMCQTCQNIEVCKYREHFMSYEKMVDDKCKSPEILKIIGSVPHYTELKHTLVCNYYRSICVCAPVNIETNILQENLQ